MSATHGDVHGEWTDNGGLSICIFGHKPYLFAQEDVADLFDVFRQMQASGGLRAENSFYRLETTASSVALYRQPRGPLVLGADRWDAQDLIAVLAELAR